MASTTKEVAKELLPLIRVYKDGSVERLLNIPYAPPSPDHPDPTTGVSSKDITFSQNPHIAARLYLPNITQPHQKLPILLYFHGGFCVGSAFTVLEHKYTSILVSQAQVVAVSVEYRLTPEHPLPAAYEDCWAALQWVSSHNIKDHGDSNKLEPWLLNYGDFNRLYIGGDSAGGNIAHTLAMKASEESLHGGVKILGAFLAHPYFWGSEPIGSEPINEAREKCIFQLAWEFNYPSAPGGIDNVMVNPVGSGKPSLAKLGCSRLLVCVAEKDQLRDRGVCYVNAVKESGFHGEVELFEVKGEDHAFHVYNPETENATSMIKQIASFLK